MERQRNHDAPLRLSRESQQELLHRLERVDQQQTPKRQLQEASPLPSTKRTKLEEPSFDAQPIQQPKPRPKNKHKPFLLASSLCDLVDPEAVLQPDNEFPQIQEWLESVASVEPVGRSGATLSLSDSNVVLHDRAVVPSIFVKPPKSAPVMMDSTRDSDGFTVPQRPASAIGSSSRFGGPQDSSRTSSPNPAYRKPLVEGGRYREEDNLGQNNIFLKPRAWPMPDNVSALAQVMAKKRDSPEPSHEDVLGDQDLETIGFGDDEANIEDYFKSSLIFNPSPGPVMRRAKQPMHMHAVPNPDPNFRISRPIPDVLYGYKESASFQDQRPQLAIMEAEHVGTSGGLVYPFLAVEFKGDGQNSNGSFWVATNQCIGDSVSCVHMVEKLNRRLQACQAEAGGEKEEQDVVQTVDSSAFSIALRGDMARLYISWKEEDLNFYMAQVRTFALAEPEHYIEFRRHVRNIVDWGRTKRLDAIRKALDTLLEESRDAKNRAAPGQS